MLAATAAAGVTLLVMPERRRSVGNADVSAARTALTRQYGRCAEWLRESAGPDLTVVQFAVTSLTFAAIAVVCASGALGFGVPAVALGLIGGLAPAAAARRRRATRRAAATEAWPRLIEELRVLTGPAGRPIPQALLDVGLRGPIHMRPAFLAAQREWAMSTDVERMLSVLKSELADPVADATCETLLIAALAGGDIDDRLAALADDRRVDQRERKEAHAKQAGARLARWFVVVVPAGMALAGLNVGDGAAAYRTPTGQVFVTGALAIIAVCWWWATRVMRLPEPRRVLDR